MTEIEPQDYCALVIRSPNRLRVVNAHQEVVDLIGNCLGTDMKKLGFQFASLLNIILFDMISRV